MGNIFKGASETIKNYSATRKANQQTKTNIYQLSVNKARSKYKTLTGVDVNPGMVKTEGFASGDVKNYMKLRDQQNKKLRSKYNI